MKRNYLRHESLEKVISFEEIAKLWHGKEKRVKYHGRVIILTANDMGDISADSVKSSKEGGLYQSAGRSEDGTCVENDEE
jgi:hypothetical protein